MDMDMRSYLTPPREGEDRTIETSSRRAPHPFVWPAKGSYHAMSLLSAGGRHTEWIIQIK